MGNKKKAIGIYFPQAQVVRVNPKAFYLLIGLITVIGAVLIYAVLHHPPKSINDDLPPVFTSPSDQQHWYANESNARPQLSTSTVASSSVGEKGKVASSANVQAATVDSEKQREAAALQAALDSPIKASISGLMTTDNTVSGSADAQNSIPAKASNLALTPQQTAHLQQLFGDGGNDGNSDSKEQFLKTAAQPTLDNYLHATVQKPLSPYVLQAGANIPATLIGGINSELPGQLTALVSQNIYDSIRGRYLLVPQGSKLILLYDSHVTYGQSRVNVAIKRIIFPNGNSIDLQGMPATDGSGYAGLHDQVDNHYFRIFGSAAVMGAITGGFQISQPQQGSVLNTASASQVMSGALGQQMGQVATGMMSKNLDIAPTLVIRPGYEFNVQITSDIIFPGQYRY